VVEEGRRSAFSAAAGYPDEGRLPKTLAMDEGLLAGDIRARKRLLTQ